MKRLVIFDLDGTLLNNIADLAASTNQALRHYEYTEHATEAYRFFVGNGINKLFERALPESERTEENIQRIRSRFIPYYNEHNADFSSPYPGIPEMLMKLKAQGVKLAVMSNKNHSHILKMVDALFPDTFDSVWGTIPEVPAKPNAARAYLIAEEFGMDISEIAFIGDSDVDMLTACNAGAVPVGVAWGYRPADVLRENGAVYTPADSSELYDVLASLA
jgi:phosphoglycolate phosphatase